MKTIKKGINPENITAQWECKNCHSIIESEKAEGKYVCDQRDGDYIKFICPECGETNCINSDRFRNTQSDLASSMTVDFNGLRNNLAIAFNKLASNTDFTDIHDAGLADWYDLKNSIVGLLCVYSNTDPTIANMSDRQLFELPDDE